LLTIKHGSQASAREGALETARFYNQPPLTHDLSTMVRFLTNWKPQLSEEKPIAAGPA